MTRYILIAVNVIFLIFIGINAMLKDFFSNTFQIQELLVKLAVAGLFVGLLVALIYLKKSGITESIARAQVLLTAIIMSVLFFVIAGINVNYLFARKTNEAQNYLILDIRPFFKTGGGIIKGENITPNGYVVYIEKDGSSQQIRYKTMDNYKSWIGKTVALDIRKGLLGYDVFIPNPLSDF